MLLCIMNTMCLNSCSELMLFRLNLVIKPVQLQATVREAYEPIRYLSLFIVINLEMTENELLVPNSNNFKASTTH